MKSSIRERLEKLSKRLIEIDLELARSKTSFDTEKFCKISRERTELEPLVEKFKVFTHIEDEIISVQEMLSDPDMKDIAEEEIKFSRSRLEKLESELNSSLLFQDPNDSRSVFLEIRAGTGGNESSLFSANLLRMYIRYAEQCGWKTELISESISELGGYKEVIIRINGTGVYGRLKFESGVHRVQRIPTTEVQGRIHTSACTIAVMAEVDSVNEIKIKSNDLRIDTFRASGAGGQHVNKTDSAVRITHLPTNLVVECQDWRSQYRNKERAMEVLATRLKHKKIQEKLDQEAAERKNLIGSGDRSERIRTYNYLQGRITDHRINLTLYKLQKIMDGNLNELIDPLLVEYQTEKLIIPED